MEGRSQLDHEIRANGRESVSILFREHLYASLWNPGRIGGTYGAVREREPDNRTVGPPSTVLFCPVPQLGGNFGVRITGLRACGRHHHDVPVSRALEPQFAIGGAEVEKVIGADLQTLRELQKETGFVDDGALNASSHGF